MIIDTPGLRELQLWETDEGLDQAFVDIADLIAQCRFADCEHGPSRAAPIKAALSRRVAVEGTLGQLPEAPERARAARAQARPEAKGG